VESGNLAFGKATLEKPRPMELQFLDSSLIPTEAKITFPPHILPFLITSAPQNVPNPFFLVFLRKCLPQTRLLPHHGRGIINNTWV